MNEQQNEMGPDGPREEIPLCPHCLTPMGPFDSYCQNCGQGFSANTPYVPFVNIKFYVNFYARMWQKLWFEDNSLWFKLFLFLLVVRFAPIMLLGVPFALVERARRRRKGEDIPPAES